MSTQSGQMIFTQACEEGDVQTLKQHLRYWPNLHMRGVELAAAAGHVECLKLLLPLCDFKHNPSLALYFAASSGHKECVELLLPLFPSSGVTGIFIVLVEASKKGHTDCVIALAQACDSKHMHNKPLEMAVREGHIDCVRALLDYVDPKHNHSAALQLALYHGRDDIFELLYPVSDPLDAIEHMMDNFRKNEMISILQQRLLQDETQGQHNARPNKKM